MKETLNTWEARIQAASKALNVSTEDLETKLATMGIQNGMRLQMLDDDDVFKFGDFRDAYKEVGIAVLRLAYKFLKGGTKAEERQPVDTRTLQLRELGFKVKIEDADTKQLLALYVPDKPSDPVTNALRSRFGSKPVIAFKEDGKVALEETLDYVSGLEQGFPEQLQIVVGGRLCQLWPVGVKPDVMVDEDPLFPGVPLRNGVSTVNNRNWSKVGHEQRQLCRIIVERDEIDVQDKEAVLRLLERAQNESEGNGGLVAVYQEAELEFRQRGQKGDLPKLKVQLGALPGKQNPFGVKRSY